MMQLKTRWEGGELYMTLYSSTDQDRKCMREASEDHSGGDVLTMVLTKEQQQLFFDILFSGPPKTHKEGNEWHGQAPS